MKTNLFKDILKTKTLNNGYKFSQGRVYLFLFIIFYVMAINYYIIFPKENSMTTIIDAIQWAILLFAAYVFGGKSIDATKQVFKIKNNQDNSTPTNTTTNISTDTSTTTNISTNASTPTNIKNEEDLCT